MVRVVGNAARGRREFMQYPLIGFVVLAAIVLATGFGALGPVAGAF